MKVFSWMTILADAGEDVGMGHAVIRLERNASRTAPPTVRLLSSEAADGAVERAVAEVVYCSSGGWR